MMMMIIRLFASAQYTKQEGEECTRSVIDAPSEHNAEGKKEPDVLSQQRHSPRHSII
jgi:hypothetical protein